MPKKKSPGLDDWVKLTEAADLVYHGTPFINLYWFRAERAGLTKYQFRQEQRKRISPENLKKFDRGA